MFLTDESHKFKSLSKLKKSSKSAPADFDDF